MAVCWVSSCPHNEGEGCQFFAFPKEPNELKKWITNLKRTDEPGPGACVCSCHFSEGIQDNGPDIVCGEVTLLNSDDQLLLTKNEDTTDLLQADPLELSNLLMDNQCDTEWTETALNENDFETIFLSETEATNINNLRSQNMSTVLRQTIESIQKDNPQIETVFVDSESEGDCNETQTDLEIFIDDDDSATDDAVDDSATDDASETAEFDDHNSIEFIDETDLRSLQREKKNTNLLDPLLIKPYQSKSFRTHYTENDIQRFNKGKRVEFCKVASCAPKMSNKSSNYLQKPSIGNDTKTSIKIEQAPGVKFKMEKPPPFVPLSQSGDESKNSETNHSKFIANKVTPPPLLVQKIALQDASKLLASSNILELSLNSEPDSRKKYLVIPNDVLQLFKQMKGSVSINIPGIGAVCVQNPGELTEQKPLENIEKPLIKEQKPPKPPVKNYDPLTDPKFRCWKYRHNVKRDLEGFSYYERMGFYRADVARAAACANKTKLLVYQLELSLKKKETEFNNYKKTTKIRDKFVMQRYSKNIKRMKENLKDHCYSMSNNARRKQNEIRKMLDQDAATSESDLLITKKVVILKDEDNQPKRRKMSETLESSSTSSNETVKRKPGRPKKYTNTIPGKRKPGRPKKLIEEIKSEKPDDIKFNTPCYVDLSQDPTNKECLDTLKEFYDNPEHLKIITTLQDFQSSVDVSKPILVVNKNQWSAINLEESSLTNNIVWPVSGTGEFPPWIGLTANTYNIKFVQPDILCKYLSGEREND